MRPYALGYSTCGFAAGRDMVTLLERLSDFGYEGVELEIDRERLHPDVHDAQHVQQVRRALERTGLRAVLGAGGRFVLTNTRHHPGAVSYEPDDRARWCKFVKGCIDMAGELGIGGVMIHSGYAPPQIPRDTVWAWFVDSMQVVTERASSAGLTLALEWHPEMFLCTRADYLRVQKEIGSPALGCTLDVGHAHCTEHAALPDIIRELAPHTAHVQLEDMKDRRHKHLRLGEGQIDFPAVFRAFDDTGYSGVVALEFNAGDLGGNGDELAETSIRYLRERVVSLR